MLPNTLNDLENVRARSTTSQLLCKLHSIYYTNTEELMTTQLPVIPWKYVLHLKSFLVYCKCFHSAAVL